ncbi:MAG: hypothetical protein B7Z02_06455 [Rhodobacterales bacterium 32-67-9]|nr:MAG: hypothetical protein B7Z02_06455 [Rhodobacterales bacterium 32-67-9]
MSDVMCTRNSRTIPATAARFSWSLAAILLAGMPVGYGLGTGSDASRAAAPDHAATTEDWHGNVKRSQRTP